MNSLLPPGCLPGDIEGRPLSRRTTPAVNPLYAAQAEGPCEECGGSGDCPICEGTGFLVECEKCHYCLAGECPACKGTGRKGGK